MTAQASLFLSAIAFVGTHFLLSHPLREPLLRKIGVGPFQGVYSLVALATFGSMIFFYRLIGDEPPLWVPGDALWLLASLLMWFGSILFVGSFVRNPALPGARLERGAMPNGVFAITRHPMMWGFAAWAFVHLLVVATPKALVFDGTILFLALAGSVGQDAKKRKLMGERFHEWTASTAFVPFGRGFASPGTVALIGGTLLFFLATWLHPLPAGFWRWLS
ncbi:MAG TPA: NnrU family protein [Sphingomicrobium sp.]|nr:NnrU family protein [Sphingomicrobium sp.]